MEGLGRTLCERLRGRTLMEAHFPAAFRELPERRAIGMVLQFTTLVEVT